METNSTPVSTTAVGLRYGLLTGLVSILISFGLFISHLEQSPLRLVGYVVLIGGMVLAMQSFKQNNQGFMSLGQGVGVGVILSAMVGLLSAIFTYVYIKIIDPNVIAQMLEKTRTDMEARGGATDEQIDQGMAMASKFMNAPMMALIVLLVSILSGVVFALIVSAFVKHSKPEFE
jgi:hypothetical protein